MLSTAKGFIFKHSLFSLLLMISMGNTWPPQHHEDDDTLIRHTQSTKPSFESTKSYKIFKSALCLSGSISFLYANIEIDESWGIHNKYGPAFLVGSALFTIHAILDLYEQCRAKRHQYNSSH